MLTHFLTEQDICSFNEYLLREERSRGTVEKYLRDVRAFRRWVQETPVTKETIIAWKEHLLGLNYAATTINSMLSSLHGLLDFLGWHECRVQFLKIQRKLFRAPERELTKGEFVRLVTTARNFGRELPALVIETICATGIRVSEVCHITVEATATGRTEIMPRGKSAPSSYLESCAASCRNTPQKTTSLPGPSSVPAQAHAFPGKESGAL